MDIARYIDAAVLKPQLSREETITAIKSCISYKTKTVCVRPCDIQLAAKLCQNTQTEVSCVLSFPHGDFPSSVKSFEALEYINYGTNEIDMVVNYGYIKSGLWDLVKKDIESVSKVTNKHKTPLKVILETCYLTEDEIIKATKCAIDCQAQFVKTSTGFATAGSNFDVVKTMLAAADGKINVKASGGIRDNKTAVEYIKMGVKRLGSGYTSNEAIINGKKTSNCSY